MLIKVQTTTGGARKRRTSRRRGTSGGVSEYFSFLCLSSGFEETGNSNDKFCFSPGVNAHNGQRQTSSGEREGKGKQLEVCFLHTPFPSFLACLPQFWSVLPYLVDLHRFVGISSGSFLVEVPPLFEPFFYFIFSRSYTELKQEFEGEVTRWEG